MGGGRELRCSECGTDWLRKRLLAGKAKQRRYPTMGQIRSCLSVGFLASRWASASDRRSHGLDRQSQSHLGDQIADHGNEARLRCAECGAPVRSVKPWRIEGVIGKSRGDESEFLGRREQCCSHASDTLLVMGTFSSLFDVLIATGNATRSTQMAIREAYRPWHVHGPLRHRTRYFDGNSLRPSRTPIECRRKEQQGQNAQRVS
jgi:hypothetical protein